MNAIIKNPDKNCSRTVAGIHIDQPTLQAASAYFVARRLKVRLTIDHTATGSLTHLHSVILVLLMRYVTLHLTLICALEISNATSNLTLPRFMTETIIVSSMGVRVGATLSAVSVIWLVHSIPVLSVLNIIIGLIRWAFLIL